MANKEDLAAKLAREMASVFNKEIYGDEGPHLDTDIDQIEDVAVIAARAAFDAVIAQALELQSQRLPDKLPCPKCQSEAPVGFESRTLQGRLGTAGIQEPVCHCRPCDRDFFPSAGSIAAG